MAAAAPADGNPGMLSDYCSCQAARRGRFRTQPSRGQERQPRERQLLEPSPGGLNDVAVAECAVAAEEATGNGPASRRVPAGLPSGAGESRQKYVTKGPARPRPGTLTVKQWYQPGLGGELPGPGGIGSEDADERR
jgi:hypothetical protein